MIDADNLSSTALRIHLLPQDSIDIGLAALRQFAAGACGKIKARQGKQFFFEKKNQKTFARAVAVLSGESATAVQKSFASFLQKRRPCLPCGQIAR